MSSQDVSEVYNGRRRTARTDFSRYIMRRRSSQVIYEFFFLRTPTGDLLLCLKSAGSKKRIELNFLNLLICIIIDNIVYEYVLEKNK